MNKDHFNYSETFCDAVDIIVSEKLKQLSYDVTKICTIVDNVHKALGKYTVQEETIKYDAYSTNTEFAIGDTVMVLIPNGDYNMQKTIVNKVVIENDFTTSLNYVPPLSKMLDFTGNIAPDSSEYSLLANGEIGDILIGSINWNNSSVDSYSDYTRMGISVDIQTWLQELNVMSGSYGLIFYFYTYNSNQEAAYVLNFDINDILGNPYSFESYVSQSKVFDISYLKDVTRLDIYFYQNKDFKDYNGELVSATVNEEDIINEEFLDEDIFLESNALNNNLFVNNLQIYLGYDVNAFSGDELRLTTNDSSKYSATYTDNDKQLLLKWIHQTDDGKYVVLNELDENIELYWVRQGKTEQPIEYIVGKNWQQDNLAPDALNPFSCVLNIDTTLSRELQVRAKVVGRVRQANGNWAQYDSNILTFETEDEHVDETTFNAAISLSIECEDGSSGNYFKYNQNSEIINEGEGQGYLRQLHLYYKGQKIEDSAELQNTIDSIQWIIPINTEDNTSFTMLYWDSLDETGENVISDTQGNEKYLTYSGEAISAGYGLSYSISNTWFASNAHNTIKCNVTSKTGVIYSATKTLMFSKANSQGSNLSLMISYIDNENAYEVVTNGNNVISCPVVTLQGLLYNLAGNPIEDNDVSHWSWQIAGNNDFSITESSANRVSIQLNSSRVRTLTRGLHYNILVATYNNGTEKPVIAYKPLAIKTKMDGNSQTISTMDGARKIVYNSAGVPSYPSDKYSLRDHNNNIITPVFWNVYCGENQGYFNHNESSSLPVSNNINNNYDQNYPTLQLAADGGLALQANPIYIRDYNYMATVVAFDNNANILWIQPILIMQSAYDFAIVNDWNGTSVLSDGNRVVAGVIAAGKKNEDNSFSGVIIGDLEEEDTNLAQTGVYGILRGATTFALTDSGNATFEYKVRNDDITTETTIQFGEDNVLGSIITPTNKYLTLDLDDQFLEFRNNSNNTILNLSTGAQYLHFSKNNGIILSLGDNNYLQSPNYSDEAKTGLRINLNTKKIIGNTDAELTWRGPMLINSGGIVSADTRTSTEEKFIQIGKLKIDKDGEVYYDNKTLADYIKEIAK